MNIKKQLKDKTQKEKANIKSVELAKVKIEEKFIKDELEIEIIGNIEEIDGGIQLFAKAWKGNKQLGFGKDGTVEIERFRFFNPPTLVDDKNGDIIKKCISEITKKVEERILKYDREEVVKQILRDAVEWFGIENTKIEIGKVGKTASTFYSDTDDGYVKSNSNSWASLRAGTSVGGSKIVTELGDFRISDWYSYIWLFRYSGNFDTSALSGQIVNSASLNIYWDSLAVGSFSSHNGWQATVSSLAGANVDAWWDSYTAVLSACSAETRLGTSAGYVAFTLTSAGLAKIQKESTTYMGITPYWDIVNTDPNQSGGVKNDNGRLYFADYDGAGTTRDPKLMVEHEEEPQTGGNFFQLF